MFDTMTLTKIVGAFCGAFLVFMLGSWAAETLYHTGGGHGEGEVAGYTIETGAEEAPAEAADAGPAFAEVFAVADLTAGEKLFSQCKACHKLDGKNGTGPHLDGVVGREVGKAEGYAYSAAMAGHGGAWTPEEISNFIANPKGYIEGTKMGYAGMKKIGDRANLVAYLASLPG